MVLWNYLFPRNVSCSELYVIPEDDQEERHEPSVFETQDLRHRANQEHGTPQIQGPSLRKDAFECLGYIDRPVRLTVPCIRPAPDFRKSHRKPDGYMRGKVKVCRGCMNSCSHNIGISPCLLFVSTSLLQLCDDVWHAVLFCFNLFLHV